MDDERLASELERRSRAASPRPDWAQRDLLPAVSREIDARPQPVATAGLAPRFGLAAVVVALLIMVVAVPRLTPQPPSATSSNTGTSEPAAQPSPLPGTMSAAEFANEFAAGTIDGKTVLVNGRIDPGPPIPRPWCGPELGGLTGCYLGQLAGVWPPIEVAAHWIATDAGDQISPDLPWERWHFPSTPLDGVLLLSVHGSQVEFVGLTRESFSGLAWSVADAEALDIDSVGIDDVVLVRGWLVETEAPGTTRNSLCVLPEFPAVDGLPTRYCEPQDYLSSEQPIDEVDAPPWTARLSVQRHAAQLFGARIPDGTSLFAIAPRLYGGGCAGEPPCWLWDIVARVDPLSDSVPPTPSPSPSPSPTANPPFVDVTRACTSTDSATDRIVELTDHAGLIESCSTRLVDWPGQQFVISDVSRGVVRIAFEDGCAGASDARLDLWDRGDDSPSYEPRYFLNVELQRPVAPLGCRDAMAGIAVDITFMNVELAPGSLASSIETSLTVDGRGMASFESEDGAHRFTLEIGAGRSAYAAGQAIEVEASLTSDVDVTLTCPAGPNIGLEQLDGPLRFSSGATLLMCSAPLEMPSGEPVTREFSPARWASSDPNPLAPYLRDGELYLPEGTYRFFARASFWVGESLEGDPVELKASVVVRVEGDKFPDVKPSAPPSAIQCGGDGIATSIVDPGDLVLSCTQISPDEVADVGPGDITVAKTVGDPTRVRIRWTTTLCTHEAWLTLAGNRDRALFIVSPSASCTLSGARVVAVELVLSRPVDVDAIRIVLV